MCVHVIFADDDKRAIFLFMLVKCYFLNVPPQKNYLPRIFHFLIFEKRENCNTQLRECSRARASSYLILSNA